MGAQGGNSDNLPRSGIPRRSSRHKRGSAERRKMPTTPRAAMAARGPPLPFPARPPGKAEWRPRLRGLGLGQSGRASGPVRAPTEVSPWCGAHRPRSLCSGREARHLAASRGVPGRPPRWPPPRRAPRRSRESCNVAAPPRRGGRESEKERKTLRVKSAGKGSVGRPPGPLGLVTLTGDCGLWGSELLSTCLFSPGWGEPSSCRGPFG